MKQKTSSHCRAVLSMIAASLVLSGLGDMVPGLPPQFAAQTVQAASSHKPIILDVAIDCRTRRFNGGTSFERFGRGDSFLADGRIFPAGTLGAGAQSNDPNDPGSIGKWTQTWNDGGNSRGDRFWHAASVLRDVVPLSE